MEKDYTNELPPILDVELGEIQPVTKGQNEDKVEDEINKKIDVVTEVVK